jgi:hypothetical protein
MLVNGGKLPVPFGRVLTSSVILPRCAPDRLLSPCRFVRLSEGIFGPGDKLNRPTTVPDHRKVDCDHHLSHETKFSAANSFCRQSSAITFGRYSAKRLDHWQKPPSHGTFINPHYSTLAAPDFLFRLKC